MDGPRTRHVTWRWMIYVETDDFQDGVWMIAARLWSRLEQMVSALMPARSDVLVVVTTSRNRACTVSCMRSLAVGSSH